MGPILDRGLTAAVGRPVHAARGAGRRFLLIGLAALALLPAPAPASAQAPCDQRDSVLKLLAQRYKETPVATGVTAEGSLVEILTDTSGSSWTIIVTSPQGLSCLILSGDGWRRLEQTAREPKA